MAYYTIHNKGIYSRREEAVAAGTISPGMICEIIAAGTVQAHSIEGGCAERLIAIEDVFQGKGVDSDYSSGDQVFLAVAEPGSVWNLLMAIGEDGAPGAAVISAGDGTVKCVDNATSAAVIKDIIGYVDTSEPAFTTLAAVALKAIRIK
jgi:hypothetical protein